MALFLPSMTDPNDFVRGLLPGLQADVDALESKMQARFGRIQRRLDKMHDDSEGAHGSLVGHRAMVERTMASFENEISNLRRRVELVEAAKSQAKSG